MGTKKIKDLAWRGITDWAKRRPSTLRLADRLGRGRARLRVLDRLRPPAAAPLKPSLANWSSHELAAAWIGHATLLLRLGGMTILTDPVMASRVGLSIGIATAGPKRLVAPALSIDELPPIDLLLLSHSHFDHLDRPTLWRLRNKPPVICAWGMTDLIRDLGFPKITSLRWGETASVGPVTVTAQQVDHWGARTFYDHRRGYCAYLLEAAGRRVLFGADTAYQEHFRAIGKVDLAIMGIGAYDPYIEAHANPEQAWEMAQHVDADFVLPMHHSTFRLGREPVLEPIERFYAAAGAGAGRIVASTVGGLFAL